MIAKPLEKVDTKLDPAKEKDLEKIGVDLRNSLEKLKGAVAQNVVFDFLETDYIGLANGCYVPVVVQNGTWRLD